MSQKNLFFSAIYSYVLGLISIPLSFLVVGVIPAVLCCTSSYVLYRNYNSKALAYPGFILGGLGLLHCFLIFIFTLYAGFIYGSEDPLHNRWQGVQLTSFSIETTTGERIDLEDLRGQNVVIAHWASWCGPCIRKIPHLNDLNKNPEITVLGISSESIKTIIKARDRYSISYAVGRLRKILVPFSEVSRLPTIFFIDRRGVIRDVKVGSLDYKELKKLALKNDYKAEISRDPRELFNGVDMLIDLWIMIFYKLGFKI